MSKVPLKVMGVVVAASCVCLVSMGPGSAAEADARLEHLVVYKEAGRFCGWPANNGIWTWGDEILVGFQLNYYKESDSRHSMDRSKPRERVMARSLDGGRTWTLEKPGVLDRPVLDRTGEEKDLAQSPEGIDFSHRDLALTFRGERFFYSYDRGKTWRGPCRLPDFGQKGIMARTDYLVKNRRECLVFLTATKTNGKEGRPFCARASDGGRRIEFVSWIGPEPTGYSIMPATVRCSEKKILAGVRRYERGDINQGWIAIYESVDDGQSWTFMNRAAKTGNRSGNPPSMVRLPDGRIVLAYGYRSKPHSIRAKISRDEGRTWGEEYMLRDDGRTWDIGYTRTIQRSDGKLLTIYYYTTAALPQQHIAATIWDPDRPPLPRK